MAQLVRAHADLEEDLNLVPSNHGQQPTNTCKSRPEGCEPLQPLCSHTPPHSVTQITKSNS